MFDVLKSFAMTDWVTTHTHTHVLQRCSHLGVCATECYISHCQCNFRGEKTLKYLHIFPKQQGENTVINIKQANPTGLININPSVLQYEKKMFNEIQSRKINSSSELRGMLSFINNLESFQRKLHLKNVFFSNSAMDLKIHLIVFRR